jgi:adenine phosphoribosyltransferase
LFEDILPIFANPTLHESLLKALVLLIQQAFGESQKPDVIVGLEARGFLFGPSLALKFGAAFVPVRKQGKLPGPTETASYKKEYGEDFFQMQKDAIHAGQRVLIVDDIIATGIISYARALIAIAVTDFWYPRWLRCRSRIPRETAWWHRSRIHLLARARFS